MIVKGERGRERERERERERKREREREKERERVAELCIWEVGKRLINGKCFRRHHIGMERCEWG
jgi:hypothetical protein